ncbi:helix-turn-helix domain-containing protein [Aeoliella sp. SH292]|uniref:helix-turn-helix domain-containing protein n=1 Tax=Aeoliella sp. SH292 TaxID=3454464 RepID=UPI003F957777
MPQKLKQPTSNVGIPREHAAAIRSRAKQLVSRVAEGDAEAQRDLYQIVLQLNSIASHVRRTSGVSMSGWKRFERDVRSLVHTKPSVVVPSEVLASACVVLAGNEWSSMDPAEGKASRQAELLHLIRIPDAGDVDEATGVAAKVARRKKKGHTNANVDKRISPERALLAKSVEELVARLEANPADRHWLLEAMPFQCRAIASAFNEDAKYQSMLNKQTAAQIGRRLRLLRNEKQLTQQELATLAGTFSQNVSEHERGIRTPQVDTIKAYAAALGIPPEKLLSP